MKKEKDLKEKFSWNNVTINKYFKIADICSDESYSYLEKNIEITSILTDTPTDDIWNAKIEESTALMSNLSFLNNFEVPKFKMKKIKLPSFECTVNVDSSKYTLAQYTDYQTFVKLPLKEGMSKLLSVILVPVNCKYNDGYDIVMLQNEIENNLLFVEGQSILDFFTRTYVKLEKALLTYSAKMIQKEKDKTKKAVMMSNLMTAIKSIKTISSIGYA